MLSHVLHPVFDACVGWGGRRGPGGPGAGVMVVRGNYFKTKCIKCILEPQSVSAA